MTETGTSSTQTQTPRFKYRRSKMKSLKRILCSFLVIAMAMLPFQSGQASMIGSDGVISSPASQAARNRVTNFLNRAKTATQMQALGVDPVSAKQRVASMTDEEVASLA